MLRREGELLRVGRNKSKPSDERRGPGRLLCFLFLLPAVLSACARAPSGASTRTAEIANPLRDFVPCESPLGSPVRGSLLRILADFNNDGREDIALSASRFRGNAGGNWAVYFRKESGGYTPPCWTFFHSGAVRIEPLEEDGANLIAYLHGSATSGALVTYEVSGYTITTKSSRVIYPRGDENGNATDCELYRELFDRPGAVPPVEYCKVEDYLQNENCTWAKGRY